MMRWTNDEIFKDLEEHHHDGAEHFDYEDVERGLKYAKEDEKTRISKCIEFIILESNQKLEKANDPILIASMSVVLAVLDELKKMIEANQ